VEPDTLSETAIAEAVASIFSEPEFDRSIRETIWQRVLGVISDFVGALRSMASTDRELFWLVIVLLALVLAALFARAGYLLYVRSVRGAAMPGERRDLTRARGRDPLLVAQEEAARGNFTDAAHALYLALLEALARREQVRLHPSKTIGDYVRELRARSSSVFARFREFARSYEVVVYGIGTCDRERWERLSELAQPILQPAASS
jgi:hypothetical protein